MKQKSGSKKRKKSRRSKLLIVSAVLILLIVIALLVVFIRALLYGDPVAGWPSMVCIILFLGGIQLLCIGVLGQYLAKTYLEVKNRPQYVLQEENVDE